MIFFDRQWSSSVVRDVTAGSTNDAYHLNSFASDGTSPRDVAARVRSVAEINASVDMINAVLARRFDLVEARIVGGPRERDGANEERLEPPPPVAKRPARRIVL